MKIINLIENTEGTSGCACAHGLSFYIETRKHKLLLDLGPSAETLNNAKKLGIDLTAVDTVVLSHGHYDHSGGIMEFTRLNPNATIYMQQTAGKDYFADDGGDAGTDRLRYIGIDKEILRLSQVKIIQGDCRIDDELELFTIGKRKYELPFTNKNLLIRTSQNAYIQDDFDHEHYLVLRADGYSILLSGCAHNGILSIMDAYVQKYDSAPDAVISGFHLMKGSEYTGQETETIIDIAAALKRYPTKFFTCHCTSIPAYNIMKETMGEQLQYVHSGDALYNF